LEALKANDVLKQALSSGKSGYVSPEMEEALQNNPKSDPDPIKSSPPSPKKKIPSYEGGLEVIVDSKERRVRIRFSLYLFIYLFIFIHHNHSFIIIS
jgi:hypothetical protein